LISMIAGRVTGAPMTDQALGRFDAGVGRDDLLVALRATTL